MEAHDIAVATAAPKHVINIVVEVDGKNKHVQFDSSPVTGRAIRERAGAPLTDDLTRLEHGKPSGGNIGLDDLVPIATPCPVPLSRARGPRPTARAMPKSMIFGPAFPSTMVVSTLLGLISRWMMPF